MRASGSGECLCDTAREYYYDLLYCDGDTVPAAIVRHVATCSYCQQQIECLRTAFSQAEEEASPSGSKDQATLDALNRQFGLLGECVTCSHVRPFLPDLLVPSQKIRIPTPVTVHVEHCPQCAEDLASLREQNLTAGQLKRLSLFYGLAVDPDPAQCRSARRAAAALAAFSFDGADAQALNHVIACPTCRTRVYWRRARIMDGLHAGAGGKGGLSCKDIPASDLFDCVMPLGSDAAQIGGMDERRDAVLAHVRACRQCMEKVQSLHRTIYAIAERGDSDIDTIYEAESGVENACEGPEAAVYRYPISVQIVRHEAASAIGLAGAAGRRLARRVLRPSAGVASLAATVLVVIVLFLINARPATGTIAGEIWEALEHAANVRVLQFHGADPQPNHEMLIAQDLDVLATSTSRGTRVYDRRNKTVFDSVHGPRALKPYEYDRSRNLMTLAVGLTDISAKADLKPVKNNASDPALAAMAVYEGVPENPSSRGAVIPRYLRVFVDPATRLPVRMEISRQDDPGRRESTTTIFQYLDGPEMENALKALLAAK